MGASSLNLQDCWTHGVSGASPPLVIHLPDENGNSMLLNRIISICQSHCTWITSCLPLCTHHLHFVCPGAVLSLKGEPVVGLAISHAETGGVDILPSIVFQLISCLVQAKHLSSYWDYNTQTYKLESWIIYFDKMI